MKFKFDTIFQAILNDFSVATSWLYTEITKCAYHINSVLYGSAGVLANNPIKSVIGMPQSQMLHHIIFETK